jgi:glycosyltransferase involved in cell wall biosynthesis
MIVDQNAERTTVIMLLPISVKMAPRAQRMQLILARGGLQVVMVDLPQWLQLRYIDNPLLRKGKKTLRLLLYVYYYERAARLAIKTIREARKRRVHTVLHCAHFHTLPLGILLKSALHIPLVYDVYEYYPLYFRRLLSTGLSRLTLFLERFMSRYADLVIVWWYTIAQLFEKTYHHGNVVVFPNLPPPSLFQHSARATGRSLTRQTLGIPADAFVVIYYGSLIEDYLVAELVEASIRLMRELKENLVVVVVGTGPLLPVLSEKTKAQGVEQRFIFTDYVPYSRIGDFIRMSDLVYAMSKPVDDHLVLPSAKIFEAMASGKAIITCNSGEKARIVREAQCGLAVGGTSEEIFEAMAKLLSNRHTLKHMGENGYRYSQRNLNWEIFERDLLTAYHKFASGDGFRE